MNSWMDLLGLAMVCGTAILCTGILAAPEKSEDDDNEDKTT